MALRSHSIALKAQASQLVSRETPGMGVPATNDVSTTCALHYIAGAPRVNLEYQNDLRATHGPDLDEELWRAAGVNG